MKKLMFAAAALAAGVAMADVTSANIVGYAPVNDGGHPASAIGGLFVPVTGATTYKLGTITVAPTVDGTFMDPESEFLQLLDVDTTEVGECLVYVSPEWVKECFAPEEPEYEEFMGYVGWWEYEHIGEDGYSRDGKDVEKGQAFLGYLNGSALNFTSSGEVPSYATALNDKGHPAPYYFNYLPVAKALKGFSITPTVDGTFMDPESEFLQILDADTTEVAQCIVYVSPEWVAECFSPEEPEYEEFMGYVGWWEYEHIGEDGYDLSEQSVNPGDAFLGYLNGACLDFNIPAAL